MFENSLIEDEIDRVGKRVGLTDVLKGANVLISGANGFIASWLIGVLLWLNDNQNLGMNIFAMGRNEARMQKRFFSFVHREDFHMFIADAIHPLTCDIPADIIIHAASQTAPEQFQRDPVGTALGNVAGTHNLLEYAAKQKARRFLLLSTREIYGKAIADFVSEDDYGPLDPTQLRSCYPEAKRMSETLCAAYRSQYGVNCRIARIAHCYGPGMQLSDGRVLGDFLGNIVRGENILMNSDGAGTLALTYITDVIVGLLGVLCAYPEFVYNISNDMETVSVKQLAELLCGLRPDLSCRVEMRVASGNVRDGYLQHKVGFLQSDRAREAGWSANVPLREGLARTIQFYRKER